MVHLSQAGLLTQKQGANNIPLSQNNMDTALHQSIYAQGYEMRKKVVGENYVAKALEKGSSDFMRPLQQFATVFTSFHFDFYR
jgi:hypothetical protein